MKRLLRSILRWAFDYDPEHAYVSAQITNLGNGNTLRILDVGCGFGRYLRTFAAAGHKVTGVDVNPEIRASLARDGFHCVSPEEMETLPANFDVLLLSHVIAHIRPEVLLEVLDSCLNRLRPGGSVIICSPLLSPWFYEDFDIIKPYQPTGILMVFGGNAAQVQYYSKNRLELRALWFRRGYFRKQFAVSRYVKGTGSSFVLVSDFLGAIIFRLSFGRVGRKDGWVGLFTKVGAGRP